MSGRNTTTFLILCAIAAGAFALTLTDWGAWAAIAVATLAILRLVWDLCRSFARRRLLAMPFRARYWIIDSKVPLPDDKMIREDNAFQHIQGQRPVKGNLWVPDGEFHVFIEMTPKTVCDLDRMNLRFLGNRQNKPEVMKLLDVSKEAWGTYQPSRDNEGGYDIEYVKRRPAYREKDVYLICTIQTHGTWFGDLSLRVFMRGHNPISVRIPSNVYREVAG